MEKAILSIIEEAEREIRRDREDLERLKKRYPDYDFLPVTNGNMPLSGFIAEERSNRPLSGVEQAVLSVVDSDLQQEWTSRSVVNGVRSMGIFRLSDNEDAAMNAVTLALSSLKDRQKITRTHEGRGRDPHRYKAIEKEVHSIEQTS